MGEHDDFAVASALQHGRSGFWWLQHDAQTVAFDSGMARLLQYGEHAESMSLEELLERMDPAGQDELSNAIEATFAGEAPMRCDIRLQSGAPTLSMRLGLVDLPQGDPLLVASCQEMTVQDQWSQHGSLGITRDAMTGLYSRHYFELMLEREWRISMRERHALSLLLIDLQPDAEASAQEALLVRMGTLLPSSVFRPADVAARYSHSRLALLLPRTEVVGAQQVAERLFKGLASDSVMQQSAPAGKLVMNMGLCCLNASDTALGQDVLMARSQAAIHMARLHGGDRIEVWQPHFPEVPPAWD